MKKINFLLMLTFFVFLTIVVSCDKNDESNYEPVTTKISPVKANLSLVPYQKLSDYNFFEGEMKNLNPVYGLIPFKPTSELFSDYAQKKRFVWMPKGTKATYEGDSKVLNLPVGAVLVKNFYYTKLQPSNTNKIIETRVMIRKTEGWIFAEYIWNDLQTEAVLQTQNTETYISWLDENNILKSTIYKTPSSTECIRCHGLITGEKNPIGIKPQNLNSNYTYSEGSKNQLSKLIEFGYLENNLPSNIVSVVNYNDLSQPIDLRVRSYFDINCAHCHEINGEADHFGLKFSFDKTENFTNMGVGLTAEHFVLGYNGRIVSPSNINQSILHYRVNTVSDINYRMPPLSRTIKHTEGVKLIEDWINSL
jgi:uncharacterized repeat protein (TIGR03806 family)